MTKRYDFTSMWDIPASTSNVKKAIYDVESWTKWWPGLESVAITHFGEDHIGNKATMTWRSQSGYRLHLNITITKIDNDGSMHFVSAGDLHGYGSWHFKTEKSTSTHMEIYWHVTPTKSWMQRLDFLLRPLFIKNHNLLMNDGEQGLTRYLQT